MFRNFIQRWIIKPFVTVKPVFDYYKDFVHVLTIFDQCIMPVSLFLKKSEIRLNSEY